MKIDTDEIDKLSDSEQLSIIFQDGLIYYIISIILLLIGVILSVNNYALLSIILFILAILSMILGVKNIFLSKEQRINYLKSKLVSKTINEAKKTGATFTKEDIEKIKKQVINNEIKYTSEKIEINKEKYMKECPNCKTMIDESVKYCYNCGKKQDNNAIDDEKSQSLNMSKTNKQKIMNIIKIFICIIAIIIGIVAIPAAFRTYNNAKTRSQITLGPNSEYIDISLKKFAKILSHDIEAQGISVSKVSKYKGSKWADKYRYDIVLKNGETIYLTSNNEKTVERIICRGDPNKEKSDLGNVVAVITNLIEPSTTEEDLYLLNRNFFNDDNLNQMFGEDYTYKNLVYQWFWDKVNNEWFQITVMPIGQYEIINE